MFYLIINEEIKKYIDMIKDKHFGCKNYCPIKMIALDEMQLLRKELKKIGINFSNDEYLALLKRAEKKYFYNTHICITPEEERKKEEEIEKQKMMEELHKEKRPKKEECGFVDFNEFEENYRIRKTMEEKNEKLFNKPENKTTPNEINSISGGFSMLASFFLLVFGAYYLGKYFFGLSDANNYKLVLVVTVVIFISETCLLLLKMHREDMKREGQKLRHGGFNKYWQNSFAYKFNKDYRNNINKERIQRYGNVDKKKQE